MTDAPSEDTRRFQLLEVLDLLNANPDPAFDGVARVAARATRVPIALLTFLGPDRQWIPARVGWDADSTTLLEAFCAYAMHPDTLLEVPDATLDNRFRANPLVTGPRAIRFYAGHPVVFDGVVLGTVCILDRRPHRLTDTDRAILGDLAAMVGNVLALRHGQIQLRAQERRAHDSEQRYRLLWETTTDVVVLVDEHNRIKSANPAVLRVFGYPPSDLIDHELDLLQPTRLRRLHRSAFERYIATGVRRLDWASVETTALHRDGHEFPIEISFSDIKTDKERLFAAFVRDISARKLAQEASKRLEDQLQQAQKMEAIGVLAGGIAHDFNNVLAGILGNVAMVLDDLKSAPASAQRLQQVLKAGKRGRNLVRQILAFARRQPRQMANVEIAPLVADVADLLRSTLHTGVRLQVVLPDEPLHVFADPNQIEQVLMNLTTNAWHALDGQAGCIQVGAETAAALPDVPSLGSELPKGLYVHLWVRDSGHGMDADTAARIFEPFYTTKQNGQGTGLGLSVAHGIVAAHAGAIAVESTPGKGSTFHVFLPAGDPAQLSAAAPRVATSHRGHGERVLYVDDDEVIGVMVEGMLGRLGYRVTVSREAREALDLVRAAPSDFDLVVTDLSMPEMSGLDLARGLICIRPEIPVVITSGNLPPELEEQVCTGVVRALLHKQNMIEELGELLHQVLHGDERP